MPSPISVWIRKRMEQRGWSIRDVCRPPDGRREDGPARATLNTYMNPDRWLQTMGRASTFEKLAVGLETNVDTIRKLAAESTEAVRLGGWNPADHFMDFPRTGDTDPRPVGAGLDPGVLEGLDEEDVERVYREAREAGERMAKMLRAIREKDAR